MSDLVRRLRRGEGIGACLVGQHKYVEEIMTEAADEIERLRDYACHKIGCARIKNAVAKCDCGLDELLGPSRPTPA